VTPLPNKRLEAVGAVAHVEYCHLRASLFPAICIALLVLALPTSGVGQSSARPRGESVNEFLLHVEPAAIGVHYSVEVGKGWRVGPQLILGPFQGVSVDRKAPRELKEWATAYVSVRYPLGPRVVLALAPVGATLVVGGDFAAVYPTGQVGGDYRVGRVLIGSDLRVIRIAGPNDTGDYWVQWIPLRIGIVLGARSQE
jgi:hypothetical protein